MLVNFIEKKSGFFLGCDINRMVALCHIGVHKLVAFYFHELQCHLRGRDFIEEKQVN